MEPRFGAGSRGSLGAPDPHPTGAHLGHLPRSRARAKNWALDSQKMQIEDPPRTGFSGLLPAPSRAPSLLRHKAGNRARTTRRLAWTAAQLRPARCRTKFTALTRLWEEKKIERGNNF